MKLEKFLRKNLVNIPGWKTNRKIVVIESDDWGSIRMPSREVYESLLSKGIPVDNFYFTKYDCLESKEDLQLLFETLSSFKDRNGAHPVITANSVVANPDFERILDSDRKIYYYELIPETYKRYYHDIKVLKTWKEYGMGEKMLWPQFHGREHLNVKYWMNTIGREIFSEKLAFENKAILGIRVPGEPVQNYNYMAAFEYDTEDHMKEIEEITKEGLSLFHEIFGFNTKSFVAPCSIQGEHIDSILKEGGVDFHQCGQQYRPLGNRKYKVKNKFWGQNNRVGQIYWRRNCTFEPSRNPHFNWVDNCLAEMNIAFRWGKPAVINSHRVNFIGSIFPENRENTLQEFKKLLKAALGRWPEIEFMTSDTLGTIITNNRKDITI